LVLGLENSYDIFITSYGGGLSGQAEAIKLSISRSIYILLDENNKNLLKSLGYLTRNSLVKERRSAVVFFVFIFNKFSKKFVISFKTYRQFLFCT